MALDSPQGIIIENLQYHLTSSFNLDYAQGLFDIETKNLWRINWNLYEQVIRSLNKKYLNIAKK